MRISSILSSSAIDKKIAKKFDQVHPFIRLRNISGTSDNSREPLESGNYISGATKFIVIQHCDKRIDDVYRVYTFAGG